MPPPIASSPGRCSPGVTPSESAGGRRTVPYDRGNGAPGIHSPARRQRRGPGAGSRGEGDATAAAEDAPQAVPAQGGDGDGAEHVAADAEPADAESRSRGAERSARRQGQQAAAQEGSAAAAPRKRGRAAARRPSGRERHDEKITVYVSAEELMDLEHARLVLRGEHGLAVDRGRIVREAVAVVLADLETRGGRQHPRTTAPRAVTVACGGYDLERLPSPALRPGRTPPCAGEGAGGGGARGTRAGCGGFHGRLPGARAGTPGHPTARDGHRPAL
ncbi:hypothetical protein GCM10020295_65820 [Streptomyces cinereospinus]